jgi:hypothetical protein
VDVKASSEPVPGDVFVHTTVRRMALVGGPLVPVGRALLLCRGIPRTAFLEGNEEEVVVDETTVVSVMTTDVMTGETTTTCARDNQHYPSTTRVEKKLDRIQSREKGRDDVGAHR